MNYGVGDTVVCIVGGDPNGLLVCGKKYTVAEFTGHCVCVAGVYDVHDPCETCGLHSELGQFFPWRFIKLDGVKQEQEEEATA